MMRRDHLRPDDRREVRRFRLSRVRWVMETALLKTLACKHDSSVSKMAARYKAKIETHDGIHTCFEARVERGSRKPLVAHGSVDNH
jgi:hypothetical protein